MAIDGIDIALSLLKIAIVVGVLLQVTPIMGWVERRGSALIQDRPGPNRVGPFGLVQMFADALKFFMKEDIIPAGAHKWLYTLAPAMGLIPALTTIAVVPWGRPFFIPTTIEYNGPVATIGWITAGALMLLAFIIGGANGRLSRKPGVSKLNLVIGWIATAALAGMAFGIGALLLYLRSQYIVEVPGAGGRLFEPIIANVDVGILVIFALASLGVYGIVSAGWASNNKYSLFGGIRASAQMISYELSLTLAAVSALMVAGSLRLSDVTWGQTGYFVLFDTLKLPAWNIVSPAMWIPFIVFSISAFAETNRLPFDFAEAEAELVAGYHTEYSSMKFALFFMSEYVSMFTMSAVVTTLFLGGWDFPYYNEPPNFIGFLVSVGTFLAKVAFLMFVFVWIRWTLPRLKYDILMQIGWKYFLPAAVLNIIVVALFIAKGWI